MRFHFLLTRGRDNESDGNQVQGNKGHGRTLTDSPKNESSGAPEDHAANRSSCRAARPGRVRSGQRLQRPVMSRLRTIREGIVVQSLPLDRGTKSEGFGPEASQDSLAWTLCASVVLTSNQQISWNAVETRCSRGMEPDARQKLSDRILGDDSLLGLKSVLHERNMTRA